MRSVTEAYLVAQQAASNTPYFKLVFHHEGPFTDYDLSTDGSYGDRILLIDHVEEPYNDYATIIFRNADRTLPNLKGFYVDIGYGYVTSEGKEYIGDGVNEPISPRLWVKHQQTVSAGGKLWELLELEGMWSKLRETLIRLGDPPLYTASYTTDTIYTIIGIILNEIEPQMTLNALVEDDGIMNLLQPQFDINSQPFEYAASILYRLLNMTASYLKPLGNLEFEIKYPQESDNTDIQFYSDEAPYFYEYMERKNVLIPNHIIVFGNEGADGLWTDYISGEAEDTSEINDYEADVIEIILSGSLTTQEDVDNRAAAILARDRLEQMAGRMVAPNDSRLELYDNITIQDSRVGAPQYYPSSFSRVSSIRRIYKPGIYRMEVALGDLGFDIDVAEAAVRKVIAEVEPPAAAECSTDSDCPEGYRCVNGVCVPSTATGKSLTPADWTELLKKQAGLYPTELPLGATKTTTPAILPKKIVTPAMAVPTASKKFIVTFANGQSTLFYANDLESANALIQKAYTSRGVPVTSVKEA